MDKYRKAQRVERALFILLLGFLSAAGLVYGLFDDRVQSWPLIGGVIAFMGASYLMYRLALALIVRDL